MSTRVHEIHHYSQTSSGKFGQILLRKGLTQDWYFTIENYWWLTFSLGPPNTYTISWTLAHRTKFYNQYLHSVHTSLLIRFVLVKCRPYYWWQINWHRILLNHPTMTVLNSTTCNNDVKIICRMDEWIVVKR